MKIYLDTTVLAALTYFGDVESDRYQAALRLLEMCREKGVEAVVSFYGLHEAFC
ncbi:MAG: hypothetical protein DDT28_01126 [Dehalococcoidia bacterium]|nr:hypothetical protein [Chloroflexota bacterium]